MFENLFHQVWQPKRESSIPAGWIYHQVLDGFGNVAVDCFCWFYFDIGSSVLVDLGAVCWESHRLTAARQCRGSGFPEWFGMLSEKDRRYIPQDRVAVNPRTAWSRCQWCSRRLMLPSPLWPDWVSIIFCSLNSSLNLLHPVRRVSAKKRQLFNIPSARRLKSRFLSVAFAMCLSHLREWELRFQVSGVKLPLDFGVYRGSDPPSIWMTQRTRVEAPWSGSEVDHSTGRFLRGLERKKKLIWKSYFDWEV